ncbi:unnamed protein product, partial [Prorocentrum cordatum]
PELRRGGAGHGGQRVVLVEHGAAGHGRRSGPLEAGAAPPEGHGHEALRREHRARPGARVPGVRAQGPDRRPVARAPAVPGAGDERHAAARRRPAVRGHPPRAGRDRRHPHLEEQKTMAQLIVGKHPKARDEAMQALATFAMRDHRSARRLVKLILDKMTEKAFRQLEGFIPGGDDVLIQEMTVSEAKARVADLPGCLGFTFRGQPTGDPVKIFFKRKAFVKGVDWTSFIFDRHDGRQELLIRELKNLERTFDFLMLSSQEDARATETLREQLRESALTDQAFVSAAQIMLKVWPACVPPVLEAILARLQSGRGLVGEAQLLKALSKHSARHDEAAIAAYCTSLSSTMGDAVVVAAKALLQHAPPGHARAVDALVACVTRLGCCVQSPILRALCHVAPRGHRGAIAALEACLTARPPASVAARRHVEIQVQVEQGLKLLRAEPESSSRPPPPAEAETPPRSRAPGPQAARARRRGAPATRWGRSSACPAKPCAAASPTGTPGRTPAAGRSRAARAAGRSRLATGRSRREARRSRRAAGRGRAARRHRRAAGRSPSAAPPRPGRSRSTTGMAAPRPLRRSNAPGAAAPATPGRREALRRASRQRQRPGRGLSCGSSGHEVGRRQGGGRAVVAGSRRQERRLRSAPADGPDRPQDSLRTH